MENYFNLLPHVSGMQDKLDKKDLQILNYLKDHSRDKISEIAIKTGIPRATVFERLEKLKREKYISKFTLEVDYEKIGYPVLSYIFISYDSNSGVEQKDICRKLADLENVVSCSIVSGEWDFLMLSIHKSMKDLSEFVLVKLRTMPGIRRTISMPVFEYMK
ncbi:Lrp/AsnC family transcriptional regulator [Oxyplasma meridianum]|uniref:Lrp/AsnC family transcriptional regulator n=1 Tax=Oxyplasma meridianum TaxID=3073602 RepID=A0AAX4NE43_9ARCH